MIKGTNIPTQVQRKSIEIIRVPCKIFYDLEIDEASSQLGDDGPVKRVEFTFTARPYFFGHKAVGVVHLSPDSVKLLTCSAP